MADPEEQRSQDGARVLAIVQELDGLAAELGELGGESAARLKRDLDAALRAAPREPIGPHALKQPGR